jgi:hypothetical protein
MDFAGSIAESAGTSFKLFRELVEKSFSNESDKCLELVDAMLLADRQTQYFLV